MSTIDVVLRILEPLWTLTIAILGPVIIGYLAMRAAALLGIKNEEGRKQLERQIRDALHQSARNGLKAVLAKHGMAGATNAEILAKPAIVRDAIDYVRSLNPDASGQVDDDQLGDIVMSKVTDVAIDAKPAVVLAKVPPKK